MNESICSLFNRGRWSEINRSSFPTVKHHNPENLVFKHLPVKEKIKISYKNNRLEESQRMRKGKILDFLTSVDIVEVVKYGGYILKVIEGSRCHNQKYNPYTEFVTEMFEKRDLIISQRNDLLQNLIKKNGLSVCGVIIGKDINEEYKCVTENWMTDNFDDRVKEGLPFKNDNLLVKLENDESVDDYKRAKLINTMPSDFGRYILSHSKGLMNEIINQKGGFYKNSIYNGDSDSMIFYKSNWSEMVDNGIVDKSLGLGKINKVTRVYFMLGFWLQR